MSVAGRTLCLRRPRSCTQRERANSMTSRSTSVDVDEILRKIKARRHCSCDGLPLHGHCSGCNTRIPEGEDRCAPCNERESRKRNCSECRNEFYLPAVEEEISKAQRHGFCGAQCYEAAVKARAQKILETRVPPRYWDCTF